MGQKVHPKIFRIGYLYSWDSRWFARKHDYSLQVKQDIQIKKFLKKELKACGVANVEIERTPNVMTIVLHSARPGMIIGRQGVGIEELRKKLITRFFSGQKSTVNISVMEIDQPQMNAQLVASAMVEEIEKRLPYRRVMKQTLDRVQKAGAKGIKVLVGGRLNGAEIANREMLSWGTIPLHTLRAHIDYARGTAHTMQGTIGVKVWIYKGEVFDEKK